MDQKFDQAFQQAAAFQKMWTDAFNQMGEVWGRFSPGEPPPEAIRDMRSGMLRVLTEAWDQFMRTPQFMEYMKSSMDGFMDLRKMTSDAMTRNHHQMQSPAREDIDGVLLAIRHMERRLLDRIEDVEQAMATMGRGTGGRERAAAKPAGVTAKKRAVKAPAKTTKKSVRRETKKN